MSITHHLELLPCPPYRRGFYQCMLCQEKGSGPVLHCPDCHFDLHPGCSASGKEDTHFSHFQHPLRLMPVQQNLLVHSCDICGLSVSGWVYRCEECDYDLHPHCARAPRFLLHRSHRHTLSLVTKADTYKGECWCNGCGSLITHSMYHCTSCKFDLHPFCVMLPDDPLLHSHPQHRVHMLTRAAYPSGRYTCDECNRKGDKWVYHCDTCRFDLHPQCAHLTHQAPLETARPRVRVDSSEEEIVSSKALQEFLTAMRKVEPLLENLASSSSANVSSVESSTENDDHDTCPICLEGFDAENPMRKIECTHVFHCVCILMWKEIHDSCPICLKKIVLLRQ